MMVDTSFTVNTPKLNNFITSEIQKVIKTISSEYNLNESDICNKILNKWSFDFNCLIDIDNNKIIKKRPINPSNYCIARESNFKQCTRNKKNDSDYCANHQYNRPNGRIDEVIKTDKKKDNTEIGFIKLKPTIINNNNYFIDLNNYVYTKDQHIDKYRYIGIFDNQSNNIISTGKTKI
jgi:hypothetical protein